MRTHVGILLCFSALLGVGSCLEYGSDNVLEWKSIKAEIRSQFHTVNQLTTTELAEWLASENEPLPLLLDARAPEEYSVSHLPNAILAPSVSEALEGLKGSELEKRVVVYCSVGYRSSRLAETLAEAGYPNVYNLEGSIFQWANEGRAVYRGREEVGAVHPYNNNWGKLLRRELWSYDLGH